MTERCDSSDVLRALEAKYNPQGKPRQYATFAEVSDEAQRRRVDWLAINLWRSHGRKLIGVEVKVSRSDWLNELRAPKADSWMGLCSQWWLAAPQGVVLDVNEIPEPWGFLEVRRSGDGWKLFKKRDAPKLQPETDWPGWLVMRLLQRIDDRRNATPLEITAMRAEAAERAEREFERGRAKGSLGKVVDPTIQRDLNELRGLLGVDSWEWQHDREKVVMRIKRAMHLLDTDRLELTAGNMAKRFREAADSIDAAIASD